MYHCQGLEKNKCIKPECIWINKKRRYCRTAKNKKPNPRPKNQLTRPNQKYIMYYQSITYIIYHKNI